ncbi:Protein sel-1 protein [Dirofilaria immitis]|nr:Protein sel-1 protein [Dirofilaria immitis]
MSNRDPILDHHRNCRFLDNDIEVGCSFALFLPVLFGIIKSSSPSLKNDNSNSDAETEESERKEERTTDRLVLLNNEGEIMDTINQKQSPATYDITNDDIERMSNIAVEVSTVPSIGDEFTKEKVAKRSREKGDELYRTAMRFLDKGRAASSEAKKLHIGFWMKLPTYAYLFGDYTRWNIDEARAIFEELAADGSADAQLALGFMHATGLGVPESSQAKALIYYTFSALGGNPLAQMALGYRHWSGISVQQSCERALTWYRKVAQRVNEQVRISGGTAMQRIRLPDEQDTVSTSSSNSILDSNLLNYYKYLADKGDLQAQVGLGQLYLTGGRGVEQNMDLASQYFSTAAQAGSTNAYAYLGNPVGQSGLAIMYMYGKGVKQDYAKAAKLFTLAAEQGWVDGQLNLGRTWCKRDFKLAIKYFQLASQSGHVNAYFNLAQIHATGTGVPRNCHTAVELYKNVAERGRWSERLMEAYASYRNGRVDEAAFKYLFLAELGYEPAQTNFAYIIDRGESNLFPNEEALQRALLHWQRSANQDYVYSRIKLGDYYYYGYGTPVDYEMAAAQYKIASDRHQAAQAMFNLGYMHEQGLGINKDIYLAKRFYDMAAETSADAYMPVSLALLKLTALFLMEYFKENSVVTMLDYVFGANWDLYAITLFSGLIIILWMGYRRQRFLGIMEVKMIITSKISVGDNSVSRKALYAYIHLFVELVNMVPFYHLTVQRIEVIRNSNFITLFVEMASLVPFNQIRQNTVNFFMRKPARELWKAVTSLSPAGIKKGRAKTRQSVLNLQKFYRIGAGPIKIKYPGLNAPLTVPNDEPMAVMEKTKEEADDLEQRLKNIIVTRPSKKRIKEKLHPLERGFAGVRIEGQKLGPPPPVDDIYFDDFQTYCLQLRRTTNMTSYGRQHTMSALIITGNGNGLGGYAIGKSGLKHHIRAIVNGMRMASKKLVYVELLENRTIYQDFYAECRGTRIFAQRRPKDFGVVAHPRLMKICEVLGIKDLECKVMGSTKNYIALTHAFFIGLLNQETHQQLAERKKLHVVELSPHKRYFPIKVASPFYSELRTERDIKSKEKLLLNDFYGEGRLPLIKKQILFYANLSNHVAAEALKHRFRNRDKCMIRLMADDVIPRWTRDERRKWAEQKHEEMINGLAPLPRGIGLSEILPKSEER